MKKTDELVTLTLERAEIFRSPANEGYARINVGSHAEVYQLRSRAFKNWLQRAHWHEKQTTVSEPTLKEAINQLEANACNGEKEAEPVFTRIASDQGGKRVYVDLCNSAYEVVEITAKGWRVLSQAPYTVHFVRNARMLPLPTPVQGGTLQELRPFLNLSDESEHALTLVLAWLIGALHPTGPYAILALHGEHGTAKSSSMRFLRRLIDPVTSPLYAPPKDTEALMLTASNNYVVAFDNLSYIPSWLSDALCRVATGGGLAKRTHYEMNDETIYDAKRPIMFNGIEPVGKAGDLLDRSLLVQLQAMPSENRREESVIERAFTDAAPRILGALYTAISTAIKRLPTSQTAELPRMADFARWAIAAEPSYAVPGGFLDAYQGNKQEATAIELESSALAQVVLRFMAGKPDYERSASELYTELVDMAGESERHDKTFPQAANALSGRLTRHAESLRTAGVAITMRRTKNGRTIRMDNTKYNPSHRMIERLGAIHASTRLQLVEAD